MITICVNIKEIIFQLEQLNRDYPDLKNRIKYITKLVKRVHKSTERMEKRLKQYHDAILKLGFLRNRKNKFDNV